MPWPGFRSRIGISDNYTGLAPARGRKNLEYPDALSLSLFLFLFLACFCEQFQRHWVSDVASRMTQRDIERSYLAGNPVEIRKESEENWKKRSSSRFETNRKKNPLVFHLSNDPSLWKLNESNKVEYKDEGFSTSQNSDMKSKIENF